MDLEEEALGQSSSLVVDIDDKFEKKSLPKKLFDRVAEKKIRKAELAEAKRIEAEASGLNQQHEREFIKNPCYESYLELVHSFDRVYKHSNQARFFFLDEISNQAEQR